MPLPNPSDFEDQNAFMHECVSQEMDNGHPQDQAVAMCLNHWREGKGLPPLEKPLPVVYLDPK